MRPAPCALPTPKRARRLSAQPHSRTPTPNSTQPHAPRWTLALIRSLIRRRISNRCPCHLSRSLGPGHFSSPCYAHQTSSSLSIVHCPLSSVSITIPPPVSSYITITNHAININNIGFQIQSPAPATPTADSRQPIDTLPVTPPSSLSPSLPSSRPLPFFVFAQFS